ncbi:MAG TPA: aminoglycoside phosphotransferase family protein [Ktedonobacteraceae bacterium]|nr:aminoglycoside phosphotransferase family protein [Ktedonobacteraceae bacterium]
MREKPGISEEQLRVYLQEQYDLIPVTLDFLPIGLDSRAGVYRVASEQGTLYLLKATSRLLYEPACLVPRYLSDQGITSVVAPLPTRSNALWTRIGDWTVTVYPFLDGDTSWTGMTDAQWKNTGAIFKRIHQAPLPPIGFESLRKESFDPTEYARWVHVFETQQAQEHSEGSVSERALRASWMEHQPTIHAAVASLEKLAGVLQGRTIPYVVCHADLHPCNLLRDRADHVFVIDWDEVMLAPKERDFLFVGEPAADGSTRSGPPAFFQGYGQTEIDWLALTYYRYERVVQDLIACAQDVCFRDDLGEETRADTVQLFQEVLAEGGEVDAAYAAAAHLPADFTVDTRKDA